MLASGMNAALAEPSFNCKYATHPAEIAICNDAWLARLDRELSDAYSETYSKAEDDYSRKELERYRAWWLKQRNACGSQYNCIEGLMQKAILTYNQWIH